MAADVWRRLQSGLGKTEDFLFVWAWGWLPQFHVNLLGGLAVLGASHLKVI